ncbi:MAG: alpha/beta fold hydrolase [Candidatus Acidiferrales bacterium]
MKPFRPHPLLRQRDLMTYASYVWPRSFPRLSAPEDRLFEVEPGSKILARCHWQPDRRRAPVIVIIHGLEGSSESGQLRGIAERATAAGFSAIRLNLRNCGGTESFSPTLYNSGQSSDARAVLRELIERDEIPAVFFAGFSLGGNIVLKMAGELGAQAPAQLRGVCAVCPTIDLSRCVDRCALPRNRITQWYFVRSLKQRLREKVKLFPKLYKLNGLHRVRTIREFDDLITAPHFGFRDAADYYCQSSALRAAANITIPVLILAAADDPLVPPDTFLDPAIAGNSNIRVSVQSHGGHCAFISADSKERYWAEARVIEFCREILENAPPTRKASPMTR